METFFKQVGKVKNSKCMVYIGPIFGDLSEDFEPRIKQFISANRKRGEKIVGFGIRIHFDKNNVFVIRSIFHQ